MKGIVSSFFKSELIVNRILIVSMLSINNNSPKAKLILLNNPLDFVSGIIQQY